MIRVIHAKNAEKEECIDKKVSIYVHINLSLLI